MIREDWDDKKVTVELTRRECVEILISLRNDLENVRAGDYETRGILLSAMRTIRRVKG